MEETQLLNAVERYLRNEMNPEEKAWFEELRNTNAEVDQMVVDHSFFLNQLDKFGDLKHYKSTLQEVHNELLEAGTIEDKPSKAVVRQLWPRYKKVMGLAAAIAGVTTLLIAGGTAYVSRKANTEELEQLNKKVENTRRTVDQLKQQVESSDSQIVLPKIPVNVKVISGTGFLIDGKGYLVTNAHVVKAPNIVVQNNKGREFRAALIHVNPVTDIAILKIDDTDFKPHGALPYGIRQSSADLGEALFTLGFPRDEIVYNEGYMSAKTGFNGDTMTCQIGVSANPGNSGGPVFNKNGEVIGIINTRLTQAQGVVFAVTAKNIFRSLDEISEKDSVIKKLKLPATSSIKGIDRVQQIKKIEDCVFMVKSY